MNRKNNTWEEFASRVRNSQIGFIGEPNEVRHGKGIFHENPEACICEKLEGNSTDTTSQTIRFNDINQEGNSELYTIDDLDAAEFEYSDAEYLHSKISVDAADPDHAILLNSDDETELREMLSD